MALGVLGRRAPPASTPCFRQTRRAMAAEDRQIIGEVAAASMQRIAKASSIRPGSPPISWIVPDLATLAGERQRGLTSARCSPTKAR